MDKTTASRFSRSTAACGRINLARSLPTTMTVASTHKSTVMICGEFREAFQGIVDGFCLKFFWADSLEAVASNLQNIDENFDAPTKLKALTDSVQFEIMAPAISGAYYLCILASHTGNYVQGNISITQILPYISDRISVFEQADARRGGSNIMICNFRCIVSTKEFPDRRYREQPIIIKEEYGASLGSHIYDSSVVLIQYLAEIFYSASDCAADSTVACSAPLCSPEIPRATIESIREARYVLELGAGCGAVSIWLARNRHILGLDRVDRILLTDKAEHALQTAQESIVLNSVESLCSVQRLVWGQESDLQALLSSSSSSSTESGFDVIVAADVLYDVDAAMLFFELVYRLLSMSATGSSVCFVAQKHRRVDPDATKKPFCVDDVTLPLSVTKVYECGDVTVWMVRVAVS